MLWRRTQLDAREAMETLSLGDFPEFFCTILRKHHGELPLLRQASFDASEQRFQRQGVVVACQVSLAVDALGVVVEKRRIAHDQIGTSLPPLERASMDCNPLIEWAFEGILDGLCSGIWLQFNGVDTRLRETLGQHQCEDA